MCFLYWSIWKEKPSLLANDTTNGYHESFSSLVVFVFNWTHIFFKLENIYTISNVLNSNFQRQIPETNVEKKQTNFKNVKWIHRSTMVETNTYL